MGEDYKIASGIVPIPHRLMEEQTALEKGEKFVNAVKSHVQLTAPGLGGDRGAHAPLNAEEEHRSGLGTAPFPLPLMVVDIALEETGTSAVVVHNHVQWMATGLPGDPGNHVHKRVAEVHRDDLDLAPIPLQRLVD